MNITSNNVKKYLMVFNRDDYLQQLYKFCLERVKDGCLVVLITSEYYEFSKLVGELLINKDQLKSFIIMYFKTIDDISRKLLLLHNWSLLPSMVAVDLSRLLSNAQETCPTIVMQKVALCAVSLLAYLQSIELKQTRTVNAGPSPKTINGLLIVRMSTEHFGDVQIQTLKDLYFYKTELYHNFDDIRTLMLHQNEL